MIDDVADWDAAYVLGALSRDDRHLYEVYLAENPYRAACSPRASRPRPPSR